MRKAAWGIGGCGGGQHGWQDVMAKHASQAEVDDGHPENLTSETA
jgi:hypothetical protein